MSSLQTPVALHLFLPCEIIGIVYFLCLTISILVLKHFMASASPWQKDIIHKHYLEVNEDKWGAMFANTI